ncbi:MAG: hypothetical protein Q8P41_29650 [Pseudomonadota bacterium]|nr:hypothetical protein [Pseudomonadota bacterium]
MLFLLASLAAPAFADSITLDTGATIEGDLARYEFGGDCQLSVTEGELTGVILIVPCHRVQSFMRTAVRTPVPIGLEEEAVTVASAGMEGEGLGALPVIAGDAASAGEPVRDSVVRGQAASVPLEAPVAVQEVAVQEEPFYDEPLFPSDPTQPIGVATAPASAPSSAPASAAPARTASASGNPAAAVEAPPQRTAAPEPTGPRMAPRMDEPTPPAERRSVSF